jgi:hypothetical protein
MKKVTATREAMAVEREMGIAEGSGADIHRGFYSVGERLAREEVGTSNIFFTAENPFAGKPGSHKVRTIP